MTPKIFWEKKPKNRKRQSSIEDNDTCIVEEEAILIEGESPSEEENNQVNDSDT